MKNNKYKLKAFFIGMLSVLLLALAELYINIHWQSLNPILIVIVISVVAYFYDLGILIAYAMVAPDPIHSVVLYNKYEW